MCLVSCVTGREVSPSLAINGDTTTGQTAQPVVGSHAKWFIIYSRERARKESPQTEMPCKILSLRVSVCLRACMRASPDVKHVCSRYCSPHCLLAWPLMIHQSSSCAHPPFQPQLSRMFGHFESEAERRGRCFPLDPRELLAFSTNK